MLLALPLALALCSASDWLIDPNGAGDFVSIQAALQAPQVVDGDRLLVSPGDYGQVVLTKSVDLLALPGQHFDAYSINTAAIQSTTISGAQVHFVDLSGISGRAELLACRVGLPGFYPDPIVPFVLGGLQIVDCEQVQVVGCEVNGTNQCYPDETSPKPALTAVRSRIALVDSNLKGGDDLGLLPEATPQCNTHYPSPGAVLAYDSELSIVGCNLAAGLSAYMGSAAALQLYNCTLDGRGTGLESWVSGFPSTPVVAGSGSGSVTAVILSPALLPPWIAITPGPAPLLLSAARAQAGTQTSVRFHGEAGLPAIVLLSVSPDLDTQLLAGLGALWFDGSAPFAYYVTVGQGQAIPATQNFLIPLQPALLGESVILQAFIPPCQSSPCPVGPLGNLTPPTALLIE